MIKIDKFKESMVSSKVVDLGSGQAVIFIHL